MHRKEIHDMTQSYEFAGTFKGACLFSNPASLYYVRKFQIRDTHQIVTVTGYLKNVSPAIPYTIKGKWSFKEKYNSWQISVEDYHKDDSAFTKKEVISYLSSELFIGIGPVTAKKIYEKFGLDSIAIVENEPEKLKSIKGITNRKIAIIKESFEQNKYLKYIVNELGTKGVSFSLCQKIYLQYGPKSLEIIKEKPYTLAYDIVGIGFKVADSIALKYDSIKYHDIERVKAGIFFAIKTKCEAKGHLYVNYKDIERDVKLLLNTREGDSITFSDIHSALVSLCEDKRIVMREGQCYLMSLYKAEQDSVKNTVDIIKTDNPLNFEKKKVEEAIERYQIKNKIELSKGQIQGIINAMTNSFSILTGGPGTGKSFTIRAIVEIFKELYTEKLSSEGNEHKGFFVRTLKPDKDKPVKKEDGDLPIYSISELIETCAPTGKAAKRVEETTGYKSKTIHRLLEVDGVTRGFKRNAGNPLGCGIVVVDEVSMIDIRLYASLISSISKGKTKVVLVGDKDQLPSVGPGNVLHDLLAASNYVPSTKLKVIFRQKETSNIVKNAHRINDFRLGETMLESSRTDFQIYYVGEDEPVENIFSFILKKYKEELKNFDDVQVLTAVRKETSKVSSANLNPYLSKIANPKHQNGRTFQRGNTLFHIGDKVIQKRNNYAKGVFNGETGVIEDIDNGVITVRFQDNEVDYISAEEFDLSYAITVHKSQGSEFDCVIFPILKSDTFMLNKPLIYTAITRAKKKVVLICHRRTLENVIGKEGTSRKTNTTTDLQVYYNTKRLPNFVDFTQEDIKKFEKIDLFRTSEDYV